LLPAVFGALVFKLSVWCEAEVYVSGLPQLHTIPTTWKPKHQIRGSSHLHNTLGLLMVGIAVPETCWASDKIRNKNHLLHLVRILLPHINDDARSKSHQINTQSYNKSNGCSWRNSGKNIKKEVQQMSRVHLWYLPSSIYHTPKY
jgi:hypothetical protein